MAELKVGGRVFTDLDNLKILTAVGSAANSYAEWRETDGTVYEPSGVAFRVRAVEVITHGGAANQALLGYGNTGTGVGWSNSTTPPAGETRENSTATTQYIHSLGENNSDFLIPDSKTPFVKIQSALATTIKIYGYEE